MKQKLLNALKEGYKQLGLAESAFERVATFGETFITSDEQIATFVKGAEPMLKAEQSAADKVRTELNAKIKGLEGEKAELEAKLNGNQPEPKPNPEPPKDDDKVPAWAQALIDSNKALSDKLAGFEAEQSAKSVLAAAEATFKGNDYVKKYSAEANRAWKYANEFYELGGKKMTAEELNGKAMDYFKDFVSDKGVDVSKPFDSDGGAGSNDDDFSSFDRAAKKLGWIEPEK